MTVSDARPGTRGAPQPGRRLMLWLNSFVARRLRKGGKNPVGFDFGVPVLTATQVSLWHAATLAGLAPVAAESGPLFAGS